MKKLYFVVGSQDLYGEECLKQVAADAREMAEFLNEKLEGIAAVEAGAALQQHGMYGDLHE